MRRPDDGLTQGLLNRLASNEITDSERAQLVNLVVEWAVYANHLEQKVGTVTITSRFQVNQRFWYHPVTGSRVPAVVRAVTGSRVRVQTYTGRLRSVSPSSLRQVKSMGEWEAAALELKIDFGGGDAL